MPQKKTEKHRENMVTKEGGERKEMDKLEKKNGKQEHSSFSSQVSSGSAQLGPDLVKPPAPSLHSSFCFLLYLSTFLFFLSH
jgi:hypothetical protein